MDVVMSLFAAFELIFQPGVLLYIGLGVVMGIALGILPGLGRIAGMSILGNQEAPKSLVIVPWKSSELGDSLGISPMLDDSRQPVDKEVFMRALNYYEIRSETTP